MSELNGHAEPSVAAPAAGATAPAEIDATLARLSAYRNVRGVMVVARSALSGGAGGAGGGGGAGGAGAAPGAGIVQATGSAFEGERGQTYAGAVERIVGAAAAAIAECDDGDEVKFMRIRTRRHELIITPDDKYILVVLQDPGQ